MTIDPKHQNHGGEPATNDQSPLNAGAILKNAREQAGLSIQDVATRLNLRRQVVSDLEEGCADQHISSIYCKGYIRSYAKLLNIPETDVLNVDYHHQDKVKPLSMDKLGATILEEKRRDGKLKWLTLIVVIVLIGLVGLWWWQNYSLKDIWSSSGDGGGSISLKSILPESDSSSDASSSTQVMLPSKSKEKKTEKLPQAAMPSPPANAAKLAEQVANQMNHEEQAHPVAAAQAKDDSLPEQTTVAIDATSNIEAAHAQTASNAASPSSSAPKKTTETLARQLQLNFSKDCWIEVRDATGKRLSVGVKKAGQQVKLTGQPPYKLVIGVPSAVSITYDGKPVELNQSTRSGRTARIQVPS